MHPVGREGGLSSWEPYNNTAVPQLANLNHQSQLLGPNPSPDPALNHRGSLALPLPPHLQQPPDTIQHHNHNHLGSPQPLSPYLPYHQNHIHYSPPPPHQLVNSPPSYGTHHTQVSSMPLPPQHSVVGVGVPGMQLPSTHVVPSQSHHVPISSHLQSAPIHQYINPQSQQTHINAAQHQPFSLKLPTNSPQPISGPLTPNPVPHTPQGVPATNPFINGPTNTEHDLHPELLALGWRKFWSKRENRWYFWNCTSGESLWEVPQIPGRHPPGQNLYDPLTDPLGIQCSNGPSVTAGIKRRASSGEHIGSPVLKKFILTGPWDMEISSNVYSSEVAAPQPHILAPHPEVEQLRAQLVAKLRQCYQQCCVSREGIDAPKESLNRWILERKVADLRGLDPIFPSCDNSEGVVSPVMMKEIMNDIPMRVVKPRFTGDARKQLVKFAEACKKTIETRSASSEARKVVKWKVDETFSWLKLTVGQQPYEAFQERLAHLKVTCQPHVHTAAKSSVEGICKKISLLAKQYAQNVRDAHLKLLVDPNIKEDVEPEKCRVRCHPALCGTHTFTEMGRLPQIDFIQPDRDHAVLKFKNDAVKITTQYLQKLEQLYRYNCVDDRKFEFFLVRSYCLLKRYNAYCEDFTSAQSSQGSLPVPVFESIQRNFGVTFECFSSPFNCYFRQYCSAFPDTDGYFGSRGNFLDYHPVSGSFEMNPPFGEDLIDASITHAEELLGATREPMSFIIFVPDFTEDKDSGTGAGDQEYQWIKRLENSRWKRRQVSIPAYEHEYRHGAQHVVQKSEVSVRASHTTVIFWLQNESGWEEWKPTEQRVDALIDSYRPGRERERDRQDLLSPERQNPHQADKAVAAAAAAAAAAI